MLRWFKPDWIRLSTGDVIRVDSFSAFQPNGKTIECVGRGLDTGVTIQCENDRQCRAVLAEIRDNLGC